MSWASLSLVTDAEIGAIEPEAINTADPWGTTEWPAARKAAKDHLQVLIEADYPQVPGVADRIKDTWAPDYAFGYTGAAYTDRTSACATRAEGDVPLGTILATAATDRLYIGAAWTFDGLRVRLSSANAATSVLTAKYWNGTAWATLSATDGTAVSGVTLAQAGRLTWTAPAAWEPRALNGTSEVFYWVEVSVSVALTGTTKATQILPVRAPAALKRIACLLALRYILNGLAAGAAVPEVWQKRADAYQAEAEGLYGIVREKGGLPIDFDASQTVSASEQQQAASTGRVSVGRA
jgi:hypothetical protein